MKQIITKSMFRDAFHHAGRGTSFSYEGLGVIFDHLEELDAELELDVVAICCDFTESSIAEASELYEMDLDGLRDSTLVLEVSDDVIIYGVF